MKFADSSRIRVAGRIALGWALLLATHPLRGQETKEKIVVDDVNREFTVRLPQGYNPQQHYPVVILLHGMNQDTDDIERLTRFDELADKDSVIVVYPAALHGRWNVGVHPEIQRPMMGPGPRRRWGYPGGGGGGYPGGGGGYPGGQRPNSRPEDQQRRQPPADDVAFINQMLDQIGSKFSADSSRIYAVGLSEGGFMSLRLGCALSDRIAAVAAVGAALPKTMVCVPTRPVSLLLIDGTSDPVVPYGGGTEHNLNLRTISAEDSTKAWAKIDHCADKPEHSKLPARGKGGMETKVDTYNGCQDNSQVVLYSVKGGGNTWPGGEQYEAENAIGKTSSDLDANQVIWGFLVTRKLAGDSARQK